MSSASSPQCLRCDAPVSIPVFRIDHGERVMDMMCGSGHTWTIREPIVAMEVQHASVPVDDDHCPRFGYGADD